MQSSKQSPSLWHRLVDEKVGRRSLLKGLAASSAAAVSLAAPLELRGHALGVADVVGKAARHLLRFALDNHNAVRSLWFDSLGAVRSLPVVCKTFSTDPEASRALIERVLSLRQEPILPIRYFYTLSDEVESLLPGAPDLVASIYRAVFEHEETSDLPTRMGGIG